MKKTAAAPTPKTNRRARQARRAKPAQINTSSTAPSTEAEGQHMAIVVNETNSGIEVRFEQVQRRFDAQIDTAIDALRARQAMLDAAIAALRADKKLGRGTNSTVESMSDEQLAAHLSKVTRGRSCKSASAVSYYRNTERKSVRAAA